DITNTGDEEENQSVVLFVDGDREDITRNVNISSDSTRETDLVYDTEEADVGTSDFTVDTEDDAVESQFEVLSEASFETEVVDVAAPIDSDEFDAVADSEFRVFVEVTNDGDVSGTDDLELYIGDAFEPTDTASVEVGAGDSETVALTYEPTDAGELDIEVLGSDDSDGRS
ncbi:hypothetical protein, partial [Halorubrum sp. Atlit-26R]|uniref:hypothetical protein n=1 Tax=Halorubrum sp. Atlit-26R TaxID=2282128 RepID=UPI000F124FB6